ncbi:MAG TPA: chloride channel protein, partial [Candidatus Acidoferrum sp.]
RYVGDALNGNMALKLMLLLLALKLLATAVSYASGNAGGIFGPSLFLGAMLGGAVGSVAHTHFSGYVADPGAYALVGMGTAFAGIVRAPMTSVVMIFEVTRDYAVIVPLMISNLVSYFIASRLQKTPIYEMLARQDGIHLPLQSAQQKGKRRQVALVMRPVTESLQAEQALAEALDQARHSSTRVWPVCDSSGLIGLVTTEQMENAVAQPHPARTVGKLLSGSEFPHLHSDQPLEVALDRMGAAHVESLPVVSRANVRELLGIVRFEDVLEFYGFHRPQKS